MIEPSYYKDNGMDIIDEAFMDDFGGGSAFCKYNIKKYIRRYKQKNGLEDLQKALTYAEKWKEKSEMIWKDIGSDTKNPYADYIDIQIKAIKQLIEGEEKNVEKLLEKESEDYTDEVLLKDINKICNVISKAFSIPINVDSYDEKKYFIRVGTDSVYIKKDDVNNCLLTPRENLEEVILYFVKDLLTKDNW